MSRLEKQLAKAKALREKDQALNGKEKYFLTKKNEALAISDKGEQYLALQGLKKEIATSIRKLGRIPYERYAILPLTYMVAAGFTMMGNLDLATMDDGRRIPDNIPDVARLLLRVRFGSKTKKKVAEQLERITSDVKKALRNLESQDSNIELIAKSVYREDILKKFPDMRKAFVKYTRLHDDLPDPKSAPDVKNKLQL